MSVLPRNHQNSPARFDAAPPPMGASAQPDDDAALRRKAAQAIDAGTLPAHLPHRTWGGPGAGEPCTICGSRVENSELVIEFKFLRDGASEGGDVHHLHIRCHAAWVVECRER